MKKELAVTNSKDSRLARRDFVRTTAAAGAGLLIVPSAIAYGSARQSVTGPFSKECDIGQGFNPKPDVHHTFGYIEYLKLGDNIIARDFDNVVFPAALTKVAASGLYIRKMVGVLNQVTWSTVPHENMTLQARISLASAEQVKAVMQSLKSVPVCISLVVYEYDPVSQVYFTCFKSYEGAEPSARERHSVVSGIDGARTIYAVAGKSVTEYGIDIDTSPHEDPPGFTNYTLSLVLAPAIASARQQILIQTSSKDKLILPWGILKT